jgi:plasmid maintenance system antidote protein VapI
MNNQPSNPFHPGEILLEEFLEPAHRSQAEFAARLGWTRARLQTLAPDSRWREQG